MNNVKAWHEVMLNADFEGLDKLLDDDAVFHSPLVYRPQVGKQLTFLYLTTAQKMFFADGNDSFSYVREIHSGSESMLEFTCVVDEIEINGVDIISWTPEGKIKDFKVMLRPNKGIEKVKEKMGELFAKMGW
jgi:hypothetical protein